MKGMISPIPNEISPNPIDIGNSAQIKGTGNPGMALFGYLATICVLMRHPSRIAEKVTALSSQPK